MPASPTIRLFVSSTFSDFKADAMPCSARSFRGSGNSA